jgi:hypothetical protein
MKNSSSHKSIWNTTIIKLAIVAGFFWAGSSAYAGVVACPFGDGGSSSYGVLKLYSATNYGGYEVDICVNDSPSTGTTIDLATTYFAPGVPLQGNIKSYKSIPYSDDAFMSGFFVYCGAYYPPPRNTICARYVDTDVGGDLEVDVPSASANVLASTSLFLENKYVIQ